MADISNNFRLKWESHHDTLMSMLQSLLQREKHVDVTLAAEGQFINVHRLVLIASSPYFENLLSQQPDKAAIIFLKDVSFNHLTNLVQYIYEGEVTLAEEDIPAFIQTADSLKIKGLMKDNQKRERNAPSSSTPMVVIEDKENLGIITPKLEIFGDENTAVSENEQEMASDHSSLLLSDDDKVESKVEPTAGPSSRRSTKSKKKRVLLEKIKSENKKSSADPFKCSKCGRTYMQLKRLKQHMANDCAANFPCSLCNYKSRWMGNVRLHLVRKHKIDPSQLANHGAGPKLYQCKVCPFSAKRNEALLKHMRTSHDD